jgi:hypothetical protein
VTNIGSYAFEGCTGLTSITSLINKPFEIEASVFSSSYNTAKLYVPQGKKAEYKAMPAWNEFKTILEIGESEPASSDVNGDSAVNMADVTALQALIAAGSTDTAVDLNGDGRVDIADIILLLKQIGGKE